LSSLPVPRKEEETKRKEETKKKEKRKEEKWNACTHVRTKRVMQLNRFKHFRRSRRVLSVAQRCFPRWMMLA